MPALSPTMTQGNIARWKVKEGDEIRAGDSVAEIETDKATMAFESQEDGFLAKIVVGDGAQNVPVGAIVAVMVEDKELEWKKREDDSPEDFEGGWDMETAFECLGQEEHD